MLTLLKNQTVFLGDVEYAVVSASPSLETLLENKKTGERTNFTTWSLVTKYLTGEFKTAPQRRQQLREAMHKGRMPARMDNLSTEAKKETHLRIDYLVRLDNLGAFAKSRKELRKDIAIVAAARGDKRIPHETTIYRWRRKYRKAQDDVRALFARFDERGGKGQSRLQPEVESLLDEQIDVIALKQRTFSAEDIEDALRTEVDRANQARPADDKLRMPSRRTLQRRIAMLAAYDLTVAATSLHEAERRFAQLGSSRRVERILELVEIDHSPIDLMVTDATRETIGRPTVTVVLCRASRCVIGLHVSLAGHGVPAVFEALRHALMPKAYLKDRYAALHLEWPCFGWPERVLMDNGVEFHADAVADALLNLGIACEYAASRSPNDKPHVERFLRTFNYSFIHKLPGTTLDKVHKRVGFKAEDDAVLTLEELDRLIHVWICNHYHLRPHRGLDGRAPLTVWQEGAKAFPPQLKMNAEDVDIEFSELDKSKLQHYGIDLNTFIYSSARLLTLRRLLPEGSSVTVKWPRNDVGHVWIWDPIEQEYFMAKNSKEEYAGLTLPQAKAVRKAKSAGDLNHDQTRAEAGEIVRGIVAAAASDKKLKTRRRGAKLANSTSKDSREPKAPSPVPQVEEDDVDEDFPGSQQVAGIEDVVIDLPPELEGV